MSSCDAANHYRRYATHCVEIAHDITDQGRKATLLAMGQAWLVLADQADKYADVCLVYETPTPPYPTIQSEPQPRSAAAAAAAAVLTD
jgi:hypothetical protein